MYKEKCEERKRWWWREKKSRFLSIKIKNFFEKHKDSYNTKYKVELSRKNIWRRNTSALFPLFHCLAVFFLSSLPRPRYEEGGGNVASWSLSRYFFSSTLLIYLFSAVLCFVSFPFQEFGSEEITREERKRFRVASLHPLHHNMVNIRSMPWKKIFNMSILFI